MGEVNLFLVCLDIQDVAQLIIVGGSPWVRLDQDTCFSLPIRLSKQKFKITRVGGKCLRVKIASVLTLGCYVFPSPLNISLVV